ncbi:MAG: sulfurtransferase, partial [Acaryochloris sp. CRU_2_0]|nr:sulfurtransferase [Acaryochloris sp. CRU_2_0]
RFSLQEPELGRSTTNDLNHIPGAYYLDLNQDLAGPVQTHGGRHPLPNPQPLAAKLSAMGITSETLVIGYDDSRFAFAARLWWLLRYLGHPKVAVLNGGFSGYQAAGYPLTAETPPAKQGHFVARVQPQMVIDIHTVQSRASEVALVDSRDRDRYLGLREPIDRVAGHIPGAVNYPWQSVTDEQGRLKSPAELHQHWAELKASEVWVYCGSGVTACVNLLALEAAGIESGKLYAGSWSDWCSYPLNQTLEAQVV